jgi:hypothetical protein
MAFGNEPVQFKFKWLNEQGQETGFLRKRGEFKNDTLYLDKVKLPAAALVQVVYRDARMGLTVLNQSGAPQGLAISVSGGISTRDLKKRIDIARSASWARLHREALEKKGEGHVYREETCPECHATLILSRMPHTPQLYCQFCNTLMTVDDPKAVPAGERPLRLCDSCGMFSRPRKFTVFYFYFLLVVYGWRQQITWRCPACMRGDAWKMLFGNLLFVLGVPVAIAQLIRSYGGDIAGGPFSGLDTANIKARKGDFAGAIAKYRAILANVRHSAGIKYNIGLGLLKEQPQLAAESFEGALQDCANYQPAFQALLRCYQTLGEQRKLQALKQMWDVGEERQQEAA